MSFTPDYVCTNPNCKSYGRAHPNCRCDAPEGHYAQGGAVHYCSATLPHQTSCEHFADGAEVQSNHEFASNPDLAIDNAVAHNGLLHTISRAGYTKSNEPGRSHFEFLENHRKGHKAVQFHSNSLADSRVEHYKPNEAGAQALQTKLDELQANPDMALNIGGNLGDTLPIHHAALAAKAATAMTYLQSIKPQPTQAGPLDPIIQPTKLAEKAYQRQVAIAEDPKLIYKYAQEGNLTPADFKTLETLYPKLQKNMQDKAFETLTRAETNGRKLTHRQKRKLGALIGQPVTMQQSPMAIQAIMRANAPAQPLPGPQKAPHKASDTELRQINKVDELAQTPLQKLQIGRK